MKEPANWFAANQFADQFGCRSVQFADQFGSLQFAANQFADQFASERFTSVQFVCVLAGSIG